MVNAAFLDLTLDETATLDDWEAFACRLRPMAKRDPSAQFKLRRAENAIAMLRAEQEGNLKAFAQTLKRPASDRQSRDMSSRAAPATEQGPEMQGDRSTRITISRSVLGGGTFVELKGYSLSHGRLRNRRRDPSVA
ncbi:hypothetical protein [Azospirillum argentinense]|uniref:hypothetical protein n=1 Tax=Azospirillum argentinense TaxID=2970906 RepID=UPI0032E043E4